MSIKIQANNLFISDAMHEAENLYHMQEQLEGVKDFSNVCRICAKVAECICPIFEEEGCLFDNFAKKINKYLPIKVLREDGLPQVVCYQCQNMVLEWDKFFQCSMLARSVLEQKLSLVQRILESEKKTKVEEISDSTNETSQKGWTPRCVSVESCHSNEYVSQRNIENGSWKSDSSVEVISDDDVPLSTMATKRKSDMYQNFYKALISFRNHYKEHEEENYRYEFSDSNDSNIDNEKECREVDVTTFDDLTDTNMRKDKMDEETRMELSEVQAKINGKLYYTCRTCGKHLSSTHTYIFHKRIHTGERPCVCHICGKQFRAPNGLQRHVTETHEKQRRYTCVVCLKSFANSQNLKQHMRIHTGERPYVCPHCGKRFTQSGSLHVHSKTHSEHYPHNCTECGAKFRLRSGLTRHRLKHTGERPHVCVHCGKAFRQKHELNDHISAHTDAKPHTCSECGAAFRQRRALRHHSKRLHRTEPGDARTDAYGPIDHYVRRIDYANGRVEIEDPHESQEKHLNSQKEKIEDPAIIITKGDKKYGLCHVCKKTVSIASWRRHSRSHWAAERYSCHTCGRAFSDGGNLARHRRALHAAHRPHVCKLCHKSFSRNSHLQDHTKSHSEGRDYVCDVCGKASKSSAALRMHRRVHEREYRFRCAYCESEFKRRSQIVAHVSVHTGERAHSCECGKTFRLKSQLTSHSRIHEKLKEHAKISVDR